MNFELCNLFLRDITDRVAEPDVVAVWSLAAFQPDAEKVRVRIALYHPIGTRRLYGLCQDSTVLATCGVEQKGNSVITIHQVATKSDLKRQGLGRRLLAMLCEKLRPTEIHCHTDITSVGFYRKCGFDCTSLGIAPSGIECFTCRLMNNPHPQRAGIL